MRHLHLHCSDRRASVGLNDIAVGGRTLGLKNRALQSALHEIAVAHSRCEISSSGLMLEPKRLMEAWFCSS